MKIITYSVIVSIMVIPPAIFTHSLEHTGSDRYITYNDFEEISDKKFYRYDDSLEYPSDDNNDYEEDTVKVHLLYECMCPFCRIFMYTDLKNIINKIGEYIELNTYPYGGAKTEVVDGKINITCQHGPDECYGNMLHACALDSVKDVDEAILFNICLVEDSQAGHGSDDKAADVCGKRMNIDVEPIKKCAKSDKGLQLLKLYGEKSKKFHYQYTPYIVLNGKEYTDERDKLLANICKQFKQPPTGCNEIEI